MKKVVLFGLVVMAILSVTAAYGAHPVFVNPSDSSDPQMDSLQALEANVQLAQWSPRCYCCWSGKYGRVWCKWAKVKRCLRTGGWCR